MWNGRKSPGSGADMLTVGTGAMLHINAPPTACEAHLLPHSAKQRLRRTTDLDAWEEILMDPRRTEKGQVGSASLLRGQGGQAWAAAKILKGARRTQLQATKDRRMPESPLLHVRIVAARQGNLITDGWRIVNYLRAP